MDSISFDQAVKTVAAFDLEIGHVRGREVSFFRRLHDGQGQGMLRFLFEPIGQGKKLVLADAASRKDVCHLRRPFGDGAGLVKSRDLQAPGHFHGFTGFEKDAVLRAEAVSHHDGHRRRKAQGAGTGNHQHADGVLQRQRRLAAKRQVDRKDDGRDGHHRRHEDRRYFIRQASNRRLRGRRFTDQPNNLRKGGILAHLLGPGFEIAIGIDGGLGNAAPRRFLHRHRFAGQRRLVDGRFPFKDHAVHRDGFAGLHQEHIAHHHVGGRDGDFLALPKDRRFLWRELQKTFQRVGGAAFGNRFQELAHGDEGRNHGRRLEVEPVMIEPHDVHTRRPLGDLIGHFVEHIEGPEKGNAGA